MLLFYSSNCQASRMLIDSIKSYKAEDHFKLVNIDTYKAKGISIPKQIHSVPALMFTDKKTIIYQKQVFDFLLLPNKGFLFKNHNQSPAASAQSSQPQTTEPISFVFSKTASADPYAFFNDDAFLETPENQRSYNWTDINAAPPPPIHTVEEVKSKKGLPDINKLREERELALQTY